MKIIIRNISNLFVQVVGSIMHSKEIEQLKRELAIERIPVSTAVNDLIQYTVDSKVCLKI